MDFQIFCMYVQNNILIWMPSSYEGFTPSLKWVDHLNRQYMGLVLTKDGEGISPAINLSAAYEQYQQGRPMDEIMKQIAQGMQVELPNVDISILDSYDSVKEHLIMRVNNADKNQIMLKEVPHAQIEDLAITYHIILGEDDEGIRCATITNELMDNLGVTVEQLHADAAEIYQKNDSAVLINMADRMRMAGIEMPDMGVYILSTQKGMFGAAAMFQPDVLDRISDVLQADYMIAPSSIHEVLIIPNDGTHDYHDLEEIVQDVNRFTVSPEDWLSDRVYHYDAKTKTLEFAQRYAERTSQIEDVKYMQLEAWGTTHDLCVEAGQYSVGESLALQLYVNEEYGLEPYASLTVNLPSQHCAPDCAFVDINGLQDAEKMILQYGIGEPTGRTAVSGFCTYPEYRFDMDKLKDFCLNPKDLPEKEDIDRAAEKNEKTQEGWSR